MYMGQLYTRREVLRLGKVGDTLLGHKHCGYVGSEMARDHLHGQLQCSSIIRTSAAGFSISPYRTGLRSGILKLVPVPYFFSGGFTVHLYARVR